MWIVLSALAAVTSGIAVILQKNGAASDKLLQTCALNNTATLAVVLLITIAEGSISQLGAIPLRSWILTVASGMAQAASWITFFAGLKFAKVNIYMALDKVNIIVTMLLSWLLIGDVITFYMLCGTVLILGGTAAMTALEKTTGEADVNLRRWLFYGILSPALQAVVNILAKLDTAPISTDLTTTIRILVVVLILWGLSAQKEGWPQKGTLRECGGFWLLSGGAMIGISYLFMFRAIYLGNAAVVTVFVKASFLVSTVLACLFLHERLSKKGWAGFAAVCLGTGMFIL